MTADPLVAPGHVPGVVEIGDDLIEVARAWPRGRRDDSEVILVEGRDRAGRVRAAQLRMRPGAGLGWQVTQVRVAPPGSDPRLPDLADAARDGAVVVHRYGRRAVVRGRDRYVKVVRRGAGPDIAVAARHGRDLAREAGFEAPDVLDVGPGAVSFSILPGRSLHELGGVVTSGEWSRWWQRWAVRWCALARPTREHELTTHGPHDEVTNLRRWLERVTRLETLPMGLSMTVAARAEVVTTELVTGTAQEPVVSHRDLHDKQVLAHGASLGLLDFDTVALAEPALDLANLWVHAALRADQGLWSRRHSESAQGMITDVAQQLGVDADRFAAYAEATRLRLACLYAFRPVHRGLALEWAAGV